MAQWKLPNLVIHINMNDHINMFNKSKYNFYLLNIIIIFNHKLDDYIILHYIIIFLCLFYNFIVVTY